MSTIKRGKQARGGVHRDLREILRWYFTQVYGRWEGPGVLPFYCDPDRVGHFAVLPTDLASGRASALFRLFVALSMYQARRDIVIMAQQRAMPRNAALTLTSLARLRRISCPD